MRNLVGLEMVCFCRSRHFELRYEGGVYLDERGEKVEDLQDTNCLACATVYYTREGDPIAFCPNCGEVDRKRFDEREDLMEHLAGSDLGWLKTTGLQAAVVQTGDGDFQLRFFRDLARAEASGSYRQIRPL